jgi:hypothetical protein
MTMDEPDVDLDVDLDRVWVTVAARVWARPPGLVERVAARLLRSPALARALVTTPSLVWSWLLATAVVFGVGELVDRAVDVPAVALVAPMLAGIGIAYAYGPGTDPAYELACTTPTSVRMVLLVRTLAVFAVDAGLAVAASAVLPVPDGLTYRWLAPMTAVSALALAVATLTRSAVVGAAIASLAWSAVVSSVAAATRRLDAAIVLPGLPALYLLVAVAGVALAIHLTRIPPRTANRLELNLWS